MPPHGNRKASAQPVMRTRKLLSSPEAQFLPILLLSKCFWQTARVILKKYFLICLKIIEISRLIFVWIPCAISQKNVSANRVRALGLQQQLQKRKLLIWIVWCSLLLQNKDIALLKLPALSENYWWTPLKQTSYLIPSAWACHRVVISCCQSCQQAHQ